MYVRLLECRCQSYSPLNTNSTYMSREQRVLNSKKKDPISSLFRQNIRSPHLHPSTFAIIEELSFFTHPLLAHISSHKIDFLLHYNSVLYRCNKRFDKHEALHNTCYYSNLYRPCHCLYFHVLGTSSYAYISQT